jgi:hypothetical protein
MSDYNYIISPEVIQGDLFTVNYSGTPVGVYSAMTQVLSSGPGGSSLLTGLTIPILITETALDCGFYSPFDGAVYQPISYSRQLLRHHIFIMSITHPMSSRNFSNCRHTQ